MAETERMLGVTWEQARALDCTAQMNEAAGFSPRCWNRMTNPIWLRIGTSANAA